MILYYRFIRIDQAPNVHWEVVGDSFNEQVNASQRLVADSFTPIVSRLIHIQISRIVYCVCAQCERWIHRQTAYASRSHCVWTKKNILICMSVRATSVETYSENEMKPSTCVTIRSKPNQLAHFAFVRFTRTLAVNACTTRMCLHSFFSHAEHEHEQISHRWKKVNKSDFRPRFGLWSASHWDVTILTEFTSVIWIPITINRFHSQTSNFVDSFLMSKIHLHMAFTHFYQHRMR